MVVVVVGWDIVVYLVQVARGVIVVVALDCGDRF